MNNKRRKAVEAPTAYKPGQRTGGPGWNKVTGLSLIDTATGEARSQVVNDVTAATLRKAIAAQVDIPLPSSTPTSPSRTRPSPMSSPPTKP